MIRSSLFRFARLALATILVALAAFGHIYGKSHHDHGQAELHITWNDAGKPHAEIAAPSVSSLIKFSPRSAPQPDRGLADESGCGCCFSGCGCCSIALWRHGDAFESSRTILAEPPIASQPDIPSGVRSNSLFRPPWLTA